MREVGFSEGSHFADVVAILFQSKIPKLSYSSNSALSQIIGSKDTMLFPPTSDLQYRDIEISNEGS